MEEKKHIIESMVKAVELPPSAYEKAKERYENLGQWLGDPNVAESAQFEPTIFAQGSFRLGTAIRPLGSEEYDIDISCTMSDGLSQDNVTQEQLQSLLKRDLEHYRKSNNIQNEVVEKKRCLRLEYQDDPGFHIDVVPSIPAGSRSSERVKQLLLDSAATPELAESVSGHAVSITDRERVPQFHQITRDWLLSNPEGYAKWFDEQSKKSSEVMQRKILTEDGAFSTVEDLPNFRWNTPLQQAVKLLKRHRDVMFSCNEDGKPISIILTTLAGLAYEGETSVATAIKNILEKIPELVCDQVPRIQNPVNDQEDFTDKWDTDEGRALNLEKNFWDWRTRALDDLVSLESKTDEMEMRGLVKGSFQAPVRDKAFEDQVNINKLLSKSALVGAGAMTGSSGTLGSTGVENKPHNFHGEAPGAKTKK